MDKFKRGLKRKLSAISCTKCGLAGHSSTDQRCPHWNVEELTVYPPLSLRCYAELTRLLTEYRNQVHLTKEDSQWREQILRLIENAIKPLYPDARLVLFGSSANGFGTPNSDLDISMRLPGVIGQKKQASIVRALMRQLKKQSSRDKWCRENVQCIPWAKVPIVKMTLSHKLHGLECDISVGNYMALHNTEMLSTYASIDERVPILGLALKQFAKNCGVCDASAGSLSSYSYILLLLHYLQQAKPPVIPVLQQIGALGTTIVDGCNCWFYRFDNLYQLSRVWPHVNKNRCTAGELWVSFFKYYTEDFDWSRRVVTVRQIEPLSKLEKSWTHKSACVEDPFNVGRNLAGHLSDAMWDYIREVLHDGRDSFCNPSFYIAPVTMEKLLKSYYEATPPSRASRKTISTDESTSRVGKRQRPTEYRRDDKTVIYIDDDDEFAPKKQRVVSLVNSGSPREVHYSQQRLQPSSLSYSRSVGSSSAPINAHPIYSSTRTPDCDYPGATHKQPTFISPIKPTTSSNGRYIPVHLSDSCHSSQAVVNAQRHFNFNSAPSPLEPISYSSYATTSNSVPTRDMHHRPPEHSNYYSREGTPYGHNYVTSNLSHQQALFSASQRHITPEASSRKVLLGGYPAADKQIASHDQHYKAPNDYWIGGHGSGATSPYTNDWQVPTGSNSSTTTPWAQSSSYAGTSSKTHDLFPLLVANSMLSRHYWPRHYDRK